MIWKYIGDASRMTHGMFCLVDGDKIILQSYAMAKDAKGRRINTKQAELVDKTETAEEITLVFKAENGLVLTEKLSFYKEQPCAQCALSSADGGEVETNYLVPMVATAGSGEGSIPLWWNNLTRQLYVPFDNDNWLRYESTPLHEGRTSYEFTMLMDENTREGLLFGALDFETWKNGVINNASENKTLNCTSGIADLGTHDICPHGTIVGKSVASARFVVLYGADYRDLLEQYGDILVSIREPIRWPMGTPFGFNAFAGLARKMSNEVFERTGDFIYNELMPNGFLNDGTTYMNLDGGWQRLDDAGRMRSKKIRDARGQKNGVYDGPFACHSWGPLGFDTELPGVPGHTYNEILLRDENGEVLPPVDGLYPLDVTHPVWRAFTKAKFDEWKAMEYDYCKLDFLTHGCMEGVHYDKNIRTGRQAIDQAYRFIADLIDEKNYSKPMFVSISIAPIFPHGFAHARRSCCDTFGTNDHIEYVLNAFTYSWWENRRLYEFNDADHLVLYRSFCMDRNSTEGEAKARYSTGVISGGIMLLSDDFDDPKARERAKKYACNNEINDLVRSRTAFRPVDFNNGSASHTFTAEINGSQYLAVFTWQSYGEHIEVCLDRAGLEKGRYRDLWTGKTFDGTAGKIIWDTEGCDALILRLEK